MSSGEKPTPTAERILLRSLSWDHTQRPGEDKIENALRFWRGLHGREVLPNVCLVPATEKSEWEGTRVEGIEVRLTGALLAGQIMLALVEAIERADDTTDNIEEQAS